MGVGNIMPLTEDIPSLLNGHLLFSVDNYNFYECILCDNAYKPKYYKH